MKYIKGYKLFEGLNTDIIQNCKDILLDLQDDGFDTNVVSSMDLNQHYKEDKWIFICIEKKGEFDDSDIKDTIERLKLYLAEYNINSVHKSKIKKITVIDPMTFLPKVVKSGCEVHFK